MVCVVCRDESFKAVLMDTSKALKEVRKKTSEYLWSNSVLGPGDS